METIEQLLTQETISILGIIVAYVVQFLKLNFKKVSILEKIKPQYLNTIVAVGILYLVMWLLKMNMSFSEVWNGALTVSGASTLVHITDKLTLRKVWSGIADWIKQKIFNK